MRILADENLPREAVEALRAAGHDVAWMVDDAPATDDTFVLARAAIENRVLLTSDKDFGEIAVARAGPAACGIVLLRARLSSLVAELAVSVFDGNPDLRGKFVVIEPGRPPRVRVIG